MKFKMLKSNPTLPPLVSGGLGGVQFTPSNSPLKRGRRAGRGFAILVTILIVGAIGLAISVSLLLLGLSSSRTSFAQEQSFQAKALADACAKEGLQQIKDSNPFTGSASLYLGRGSCSYTVTSQGGGNRTITASSTIGSSVRKVKILIDAVNPQVNVTSWQELADF